MVFLQRRFRNKFESAKADHGYYLSLIRKAAPSKSWLAYFACCLIIKVRFLRHLYGLRIKRQ
jgi:hypothetical protein